MEVIDAVIFVKMKHNQKDLKTVLKNRKTNWCILSACDMKHDS